MISLNVVFLDIFIFVNMVEFPFFIILTFKFLIEVQIKLLNLNHF
jgi:hypothetical protein